MITYCKIAFTACYLVLLSPVSVQALPEHTTFHVVPQGAFNNDVMDWSPAHPDAVFARSTIPLQARIDTGGFYTKNTNTRSGQGQIMNLDIAFPDGSPMGRFGNQSITFTHWGYLDHFVLWGGAANTGIISLPTGDMTDISHQNGIPAFGTVFFPPAVYGGQFSWVQTFITKNGDGSFSYADKLIEMADYYGFDGWFINLETAGGGLADAKLMRDFIQYYRAIMDARSPSEPTSKIIWYDSMVESGQIAWQDRFNSNNDWYLKDGSELGAEHIFIDFGSVSSYATASRIHAQSLGLDPYETVFLGMETQFYDFKTDSNLRFDLTKAFPLGQDHRTSVGLYVPMQHTANLIEQDQMWVGPSLDPRDTAAGYAGWRGIAHYINARSTITSMPFATSFGIGSGSKYYIKGKEVTQTPSTRRALQDHLPTWRWMMDSTGADKLSAELADGSAYNGYGHLKLSGLLNGINTLPLFYTQLLVDADTYIDVTFRNGVSSSSVNVDAFIIFADAPNTKVYYALGSSATSWQTSRNSLGADIGGHIGRTIQVIGIRVDGYSASPVANYDLLVGEIAVSKTTISAPAALTNLEFISEAYGVVSGKLEQRFKWDHSTSDQSHYNVYGLSPDGLFVYLGSCVNNYFYADVTYASSAGESEIYVQVVGKDHQMSDLVSIGGKTLSKAAGLSRISMLSGNLLQNPNFENGTLNGWFRSSGVTIASNNGPSAAGSYAAEIPSGGAGNNDLRTQSIPVTEGQTYDVSWDYNVTSNGLCFGAFRWFDASNNYLGQTKFSHEATGGWVTHSFTSSAAPAGVDHADILLRTKVSTNAGSLIVDNISVKLVPAVNRPTYFSWILDYDIGEQIDEDDDADNDGISNLLEFALGGDPSSVDASTVLPVVSVGEVDGDDVLVYAYRRRTDAFNLTYSLLLDDDLVAGPVWTNLANFYEIAPTANTADPNIESVTNHIPMDDPMKFVTLEVIEE
jgi:endo-beta-N-acetylglucosaminidase D